MSHLTRFENKPKGKQMIDDLHGKMLQSLSINDSRYATADFFDDRMDIDEEFTYPDSEKEEVVDDEINTGDHYEEYEEDDSSHYQEEETSFSDMLSPTALGAKLAMQNQKLLMPPPSSSDLVDYEYELSNYQNVSLFHPESNLSSFINKDEQVNNKDRQLNSFNNSNEVSGFPLNTFNQNNYIPLVQIHHHHYYYENTPKTPKRRENIKYTKSKNQRSISDSFKKEGVAISKSLTNRSSRHLSERVDQEDLNVDYKHLSADQTSHDYKHDHQLSYPLPLPWEAKARPVEGYYYMVSSILQLVTNLLVGGFVLYQIFTIIRLVKGDINQKVKAHSRHVMLEIERATRNYYENDCSPDLILPALEVQCSNWEKIMNLDPNNIGNHSSISAETIGIILNSLIEPLGIKFILISFGLVVVIYICNFSFGYIRAKSYYGWEKEKHL